MALQIWLPLTKDLNNQGISGVSFNNTNSSIIKINSSGKLGNCYERTDTSGNYLYSNGTVHLGTKLSMFCWINFTSLQSSSSLTGICGTHRHSTNTGMGITIKYVSSTTGYISCNTGTGSSRTFNTYCGSTLLSAGTWYHVGFTYDGSNIKLYVNGHLDKTQAFTGMSVPDDYFLVYNWAFNGASGTAVSSYASPYKLNDVRAYDHCLSEKEIKELAKGLVLHYPLNHDGLGGENIIAGTSPIEVQYTYPSSGYSDKYATTTTIVPSASQYTLSFLAKSTVNGDKIRTHFYSPNTTTNCVSSQGATSTASDGSMTFTLSTEWKLYWVTYTQSSTTAVKHIICPRMWSVSDQASMSGTGTVSMKCMKLEAGAVPTPWIPNVADSNYSLIQAGSTIIEDISGNHNNAIIHGSPTIVGDSPKYSCAINFITGTYAQTDNLCPTGYANTYTFAFWAKFLNGGMVFGHSNGNRLNLYSSNYFSWNTGDGNNNLFKTDSGASIAVSNYENVWHHYAVTGDGTVVKLYIDGQYIGKATTFRQIAGTTLILNGWDSSTSYEIRNPISDFRIYATPLTADQVKELYSTAASLSDNGTLFANEFIEM